MNLTPEELAKYLADMNSKTGWSLSRALALAMNRNGKVQSWPWWGYHDEQLINFETGELRRVSGKFDDRFKEAESLNAEYWENACQPTPTPDTQPTSRITPETSRPG